MIILGAMSGTSTDAVDVAALSYTSARWTFLGMHSIAFKPDLQARLLQLQAVPWLATPAMDEGVDPVMLMLRVRRDLTLFYAQAVQALMQKLGLSADNVLALGAHGQTLRHRPLEGITYQLLDPALLAIQTGVPVVADLRSADIALGGQGAPLVPGFHAAWLYQALQDQQGQQAQHQNATVQTSPHALHPQQAVAVLNLGGFANLTLIPNGLSKPADALSQIQGGDCGPANVLMDAWARQHFGCVMDRDGRIAAQGQVHQGLLKILLQHPFFALPWPKSTGRDDFTEVWLAQCLQAAQAAEKTKGAAPLREVDVMATLLQLTVDTVVACVPHHVQSVYVCGGGSYNPVLLAALQRALQCRSQQPISVMLFDALGLPAQAVEACAFAWLAAQYMQQKPGNCIGVTGAKQQAVLGALHWGTKTTA